MIRCFLIYELKRFTPFIALDVADQMAALFKLIQLVNKGAS